MAKLPDATAFGARPDIQPGGRRRTVAMPGGEGLAEPLRRAASAQASYATKAGEGTEALAGAAFKTAVANERLLAVRRATEVDSAVTRAAADMKVFVLDLKNDPDVETYGKRFEERSKKAFDTHSKGLDSQGLATFQAKYDSFLFDQALKVRELGNLKLIDQSVAKLDQTLEETAQLAAQSNSKAEYDKLVAHGTDSVEKLVQAGMLTAVDGGNRVRAFRGGLDEIKVMQEITANPGRAAQMLGNPNLFTHLDPKRRQALLNSAISQAKTDAAIFRAEYTEDLKDYVAGLNAGAVDVDARFSEKEVKRVYGAEKGARLWEEVQAAEKFGTVLNEVAFATPEELGAKVAKESADLATGQGFRRESQELRVLQQAISQRETALKNDPASYVLRQQSVRKAYDTMSAVLSDEAATPEDRVRATRAYAQASETEQRRLGVFEPKLLTDRYVDQIAAQFREGGQNVAQVMAGLQQQWGPYWSKVNSEMGDKVSPDVWTIGKMPPGPAATRIAEISGLKAEDLKKGLTSDDISDAKNALAGALEPFRLTVKGQKRGDESFARLYSTAEKLTLSYLGQGMKPSVAGRRAAAEVVMDRYEFQDGYRVPRGVDAGAVSRGTRDALVEIGSLGVDLPTSLAGLPEKETREAYVRQLQAHGKWVTSPDETGLTLYDDSGGAVTVNGQPLSYSWNELAVRALKESARPDAAIGTTGRRAPGTVENPLATINRPRK